MRCGGASFCMRLCTLDRHTGFVIDALYYCLLHIHAARRARSQVKNVLVEHAFEMSSFVFFVGPMTLICVLYVLIGFKLHKSKLLQGVKRRGVECGSTGATGRSISGQTRVIRMLGESNDIFFLFFCLDIGGGAICII